MVKPLINMLLDIVLLPENGYPLWFMLLCTSIAVIGILWTKIKSTFELWFVKKHDTNSKKIEKELSEIETLKKRVQILEDKNLKLEKMTTAYAMTLTFIVDEYEKGNPENVTIIRSMKNLIQSTINDDQGEN